MSKMLTIAVVNGGGDAPGLNAVIRGALHSAIKMHCLRTIGAAFGDLA